jgi:hypothetical protein
MPRTFTTVMTDELNKQYGGESMLLLEVAWNGTTFHKYTDRKLNGAEVPEPRILQAGNFNSTTVINGGSDSKSVQVVLDDSDGVLRALIDDNDIHLFQGLPATESALMFEGVINSPLVWSEPERTLSFTVLSKREETEAGFTMEDGDFPYIPADQRGKAWPLVFGQVCNMEAVQVTALRKGFLAQGVGVPDPTLDERLCQANYLQCPLIPEEKKTGGIVLRSDPILKGYQTYAEWKQCCDTWTAFLGGCSAINWDGRKVSMCGPVPFERKPPTRYIPDPQCVERKHQEICKILRDKELQESYVVNPFIVRGGENFPQGQKITIEIKDVRFEGVMTGESFLVSSTFHPALDDIDNPVCSEVPPAGWGWRYDEDYNNPPTNIAECDAGGTNYQKDIRNGSAASWEYYESFEKGDFIWLPPGAEVRLTDESDLVHIVSLLPGVVNQVAAYRTYGDTALLTQLPTNLYTVHLEDYNGYQTTEIWLDKPLSEIEDVDWDDTLYVSFTSSVGPNPVDIITYLVGKYTDYTIDPTSFVAVGNYLTNYPSNFFIKERPNVMDLIGDIAYQARCAVFIRDNVVYITYLPAEPTSLKTLTESDILHGTFRFEHSRTESLETKHTISWSDGEAGVYKDDPTDFEFILKHNVPKYGNFDASYDYYTYNIFELVEKSATFWMIRKANTWRYVEFETPMKHLDLDVFDCVTLDIVQFPTTKVVIESTAYNADSNTIKFRCWTPIRSGEDTPYYWAWPSQQAATAVFPLVSDASQESGDGTGITVIPPTTHPLYGGYDPDVEYPATDGDRTPSDLDDSLPTLTCKVATGSEIADDIEPDVEIDEPLASANFQDKLASYDAGNAGGGGSGSDDDESKGACGEEAWGQSSCEYEVTVLYVSPATLTTTQTPTGNCKSAGPCKSAINNGVVCTGPLWQMCHSFGALFAARFFSQSKQAEGARLIETCGHNYGMTAVYTASDPVAIPCTNCIDECEDPAATGGDPDHPAADVGQIRKPTCITDPDNCRGDEDGWGASGGWLERPPDELPEEDAEYEDIEDEPDYQEDS